MLYEDENNTREKLLELRKSNICAVCKGTLDVFLDADSGKAFLACRSDFSHQGIERIYEPTPFEKKGYGAFNIPTRRDMMEKDYGKGTGTRLMKYEGVVSLTRAQAMEVLRTIWPDAPDTEVVKAAMICHQYGLNPLMKHVFLIPFKRRKEGKVVGVDWATVLGINANRLIAQRPHNFSYLDLSPRRMTDAEQEKVLGEVDDSRIWAITKIKDMATGAEAMGVGSWPKDEVPYGVEKGNTKLNMACIRSERQALDRQYPGEMPQGVEVIDERYGAADTLISEGGDKIGEQAGETQSGEGKPGTTILSSPQQETTKIEVPAELAGEGFHIDPTWLKECLGMIKWSDDTTKTFLAKYKVSPQGTLEDVIKRLTREQVEEFVKEIQNRVAQKQMELFD